MSVTLLACGATDDAPSTADSGGMMASSSDSTSGAATDLGGPQTSDTSTSAVTTVAPETQDETSSTTSTFPPGPVCSVQEVSEGALLDPLDKGDEPGKFPVLVGDTLEDYCGCHTLNNNGENLKFMYLKAPGGTLWLNYDDLSRSFGGGTLGQAMSEQVVVSKAMPPGSCSYPDEPAAVLRKWFEDGMPDGATFEYP